jgi:hypothetical protein
MLRFEDSTPVTTKNAVDSLPYQISRDAVGLKTGPHKLVRKIDELLE